MICFELATKVVSSERKVKILMAWPSELPATQRLILVLVLSIAKLWKL